MVGELDGSRPVVHVSQGTVANVDFGELVGPTLEALADEPVLGRRDDRQDGRACVGTLPPLPANARAAEFLPYAELMPKVSAFVTNGGYGGLHEAMRHGVPIVVAGDTEDKLETSARVAWSGAGLSLRTGHPTPEAIRTAVREVLAKPQYRDASGSYRHRHRGVAGCCGLRRRGRAARRRASHSDPGRAVSLAACGSCRPRPWERGSAKVTKR